MGKKIAMAASAATLVAAILAPGSAGAARLSADFQFQDTYASSVAGPGDIANVGNGNKFVTETVGCTPRRVLSFPKGSGLQLQVTGVPNGVNNNWYSIVVLFRLADLSGYRRIMAPSWPDASFSTDNGLYDLDGRLAIFDNTTYPPPGPTVVFADNTYAEVAFTYRSTATPGQQTAGYVNGAPQVSYPSPGPTVLAAVWMRFFKDNDSGGTTNEDSAGAVARIRIYYQDLTAGEVAAIHAASPIAGACDPTRRASAAVNGKVKVKRGKHGRFIVLTGIDAGCPALGGRTCEGTAAVDRAGASKRLAAASNQPKSLGTKALSVAPGETETVKVKLTRKASNALRDKGKLKAKITVKVAPPGGATAVASRTAKLKPPRPKR